MIIGTDISLAECKESGYLMMEYKGRKFDPSQQVKFIRCYDRYTEFPFEYLKHEVWLDTGCVWESYESHKQGIDKCCDCDFKSIDDIKTWYDLLHLADVTDAYCGIFY